MFPYASSVTYNSYITASCKTCEVLKVRFDLFLTLFGDLLDQRIRRNNAGRRSLNGSKYVTLNVSL